MSLDNKALVIGKQQRELPYKSKFNYTINEIKRNKISYLMIAPYGIIFFVFTVLPVLVSMGLSFTYYNILEPPKFIGWQNYIRLFFSDEIFLQAIKNTLQFAVITGPIGYIAALLLAWLINELPPKVRAFAVLIFYAPTISGQVYMIWRVLFSGDAYGYVNGILMELSIIFEPIKWLENKDYVMTVVIIAALWMSLGAGFLAFVAGLQGIDKAMYEAGYVEGVKNRWQELWYITLPSMRPQLMFGAVMSITTSFAVCDITMALAGFPSANYAARTVVTHLIDYGTIRYEMGYASSIATVLFLIMIGTNKVVQNLLKKLGR